MQKLIKRISAIPFALLAFGLASCSLLGSSGTTTTTDGTSYSVDDSGSEATGSASSSVESVTVSSDSTANATFTDSDSRGNIVLKQGASTTTVSSGVTIDNANNIIHITASGTYVVTGTLSDGNILIETPTGDETDVVLDLNGVSITKSSSANNYAPIFSSADAHLKLKKVESSTSVVIDKRTADTGDDSAAIFSNKKLKIVGSGSLYVKTTYNNGIASDSHIEAKNGAVSVTAVNHCFKAHKSIILGDASDTGSFTLVSTGADGGGLRVDEVEAVATPVYGGSASDDDINGIEIKSCALNITAVGKGISSAAYVYMEDGNGAITSSKDKGIKADLNLLVDGGTFTVKTPVDDCLHSSSGNVVCGGGTYTLTSGTSDGCQGIKGENYVYVNGGYFNVTASYEGIAAHQIVMNGGTTLVNSSDDGWSAGGTSSQDSSACSISINAGYHYVYANGDGIDSNGNLTISGGVTVVSQSSNANGPLDYGESVGTFTQSGGLIIAYGAGSMTVNPTAGNQGSVLVSCSASSGSYLGFLVGTEKYAIKLTKAASNCYASFPSWASGVAYGVYTVTSPTVSDTVFSAGNVYKVSSYTAGTTLASGTFSSSSLHVGTASGMGGGGGPGGGGHGW